jgi:PAS domain S-box-containing protein
VSASPPAAILLVDDSAGKRLALRAVLTPLGHPVIEADSGKAALRCLMAQDFAVILLDISMPEMDGFETAAFIRQRQQSQMTPIIFITSYASDEILPTSRYVQGAVDFIFAPVQPHELRAKVTVFVNLFTKAAVLTNSLERVQTSADQLRLLTEAAPIGIFKTDADNRYVYTNPRWSQITGIAADDALRQKWDAIIDPAQRTQLVTPAVDDADAAAEFSHRFELRPPGMPARIVLLTSKSVPGTGDGIAGWVGTLADVTAEAGAEAAMADARDRATETSRLKSDFLANMSHEIRTPMNGVIGMTDLLLETELDDAQRDYALTVRNSGEALLVIINDILDFSKVEAGKLEIVSVDFAVRGVVAEVVDLLGGSAADSELGLHTEIADSVPAVLCGDPGRVRQVLINLVGNAIKFTPAGRIDVRVTGGDGTDLVRFDVSDSGDGIAADKLGSLFQPFVQADTSTTRRHGGTGLGLAISQRLVALMGGSCGVSSELGEGSTFWFTIAAAANPSVPRQPTVADVIVTAATA